MADERMRVAVYFANATERQQATEVLANADQPGTTEYSGVIEARVPLGLANELTAMGLSVERLDATQELSPLSPKTNVSKAAIEELKAEALKVRLDDESGALVVDPDSETVDPRIHQSVDYEPAPEDALDTDAYFIHLAGPITLEQRLEFDSLGVDIAGFRPPHRYRTMLTNQQYARVLELSYVESVSRYRFEDAITAELVELGETIEDEGAALASDEDEGPQMFDCSLHRERDLPEIEHLIEATEGIRVVGTSNLTVRFEGQLGRPLLAALAALAAHPAVRKLSPYNPPEL